MWREDVMKLTETPSQQLDLFVEVPRSFTHVKRVESARSQLDISAPVVMLQEKRLEKEEQAERRITRKVLALLDL
jgi:hypothetical protein